ncbi:hypothetical protein MMC29_007316, partial [Sticta canariensis]|nr:hypothetical protein [Sticta canariensis]
MADPSLSTASEKDFTSELDDIDLETADVVFIRKYVAHNFRQYEKINAEDQSLWDAIQADFQNFEEQHFACLTGPIWKVVKDCFFPRGYWIDQNYGPGRSRQAIMVKAVAAEWWDNEWTLSQIQWVEEHYGALSRMTRKRKQELT